MSQFPSNPDEVAGQMPAPFDNPIQCEITRQNGEPVLGIPAPDASNLELSQIESELDEYAKALEGSGFIFLRNDTKNNGGIPIVNVPTEVWQQLEKQGYLEITLPSGYRLDAEMP